MNSDQGKVIDNLAHKNTASCLGIISACVGFPHDVARELPMRGLFDVKCHRVRFEISCVPSVFRVMLVMCQLGLVYLIIRSSISLSAMMLSDPDREQMI